MKQIISKIFFIVSAVVLVALHTVQLAVMTDNLTGFFKPEYQLFGFVFGVFFALVFVMMIYFGLQRKAELRTPVKIGLPLSIVSLISSVGFLAGNVFSSLGAFTIGSFVKMFMAIITSAFFLVFGLCGLLRVAYPKVLALLSVPYFVYCLIETFMRNSGMSLISENIYEIVMLIAVLLFFLYATKFLCDVNPEKNAAVLIPVGFIASALCFVCTVPRYLIIFTGNADVLKVNKYPDFSIFISGLFIAFFCFRVLNACKVSKIVKEAAPKKEQATIRAEEQEVPAPAETITEEEQTEQPADLLDSQADVSNDDFFIE